MSRLTRVVGIVVMVVASGCATQMGVQQQAVTLAGKTYHYVVAEAKDPAGINFSVMDRYDGDGKLIARDAASGAGILHAVIPAVIDGAATAGGLIGAAAVLRPDTTNVTQTTSGGGVADGASGSGGGSDTTTITVSPTVTSSSSSSPVSTSSATSGSSSASTSSSKSASSATAKQSQTQSQSQSQTSNNTNTNTNTNTSTSSGNTKTHTNHGHHYGHDKDKGDK